MSLDIQSECNSQTTVIAVEPDSNPALEHVERLLFFVASTLSALAVSAVWVMLSLG